MLNLSSTLIRKVANAVYKRNQDLAPIFKKRRIVVRGFRRGPKERGIGQIVDVYA